MPGTCAISVLRDILENLFISVSPSVVLSTKPTDIKEVQVSTGIFPAPFFVNILISRKKAFMTR